MKDVVNKSKRMKRLNVVFFSGCLMISVQALSSDPSHRGLLEQRLSALEKKKESLESVPGSLAEQRTYQARIDSLKQKLGQDIRPFLEHSVISVSQKPLLKSGSDEPVEVDYFHDRSQIVAVDQSIHDQGSIHPHSTLLDELPPTHLSRSISEPPKKGIVIDGSESKESPALGGVVQASDLGRSGVHSQLPESGLASASASAPPPHVQVSTASMESHGDPFRLHEPKEVKKVEGASSVQGLQLPQGGRGMPPPVWGQAASARDYANKTGWSIDPIPIQTPIFYGAPTPPWGFSWGMPSVRVPAGQQGPYWGQIPQGQHFSNPTHKFTQVWP